MSGMDRMTELLPCPFCGGEVEMMGNQVFCNDCEMGSSPNHDLKDAIAAWNRRASQAAPAPSDGLRGKTPTTIAHEMTAELDRMGLSYPPVDAIARALGAALTPAPAQEGGE